MRKARGMQLEHGSLIFIHRTERCRSIDAAQSLLKVVFKKKLQIKNKKQ
jgi:hypothetical protein